MKHHKNCKSCPSQFFLPVLSVIFFLCDLSVVLLCVGSWQMSPPIREGFRKKRMIYLRSDIVFECPAPYPTTTQDVVIPRYCRIYLSWKFPLITLCMRLVVNSQGRGNWILLSASSMHYPEIVCLWPTDWVCVCVRIFIEHNFLQFLSLWKQIFTQRIIFFAKTAFPLLQTPDQPLFSQSFLSTWEFWIRQSWSKKN